MNNEIKNMEDKQDGQDNVVDNNNDNGVQSSKSEGDLVDDFDLLSALGGEGGESSGKDLIDVDDNNTDIESQDEEESGFISDVEELTELFKRELAMGSFEHDGTGDIHADMINWISDEDKLPSTPLASFLSNYRAKMRYSMYLYHLSQLMRMKNLADFVRESEEVIFNKDLILGMEEEELKTRYFQANKSLNEIMNISRRLFLMLQKDNEKGKKTPIDKLSMLLGALPSHKLREFIKLIK